MKPSLPDVMYLILVGYDTKDRGFMRVAQQGADLFLALDNTINTLLKDVPHTDIAHRLMVGLANEWPKDTTSRQILLRVFVEKPISTDLIVPAALIETYKKIFPNDEVVVVVSH